MSNKSLGELIDELQQIREERRELDTQSKELSAKYKEIEAEIIEKLQRAGLDQGRGELASASLSENEVPSVTDWNKAMRWIKREGALYIFERRIAKGAWQELVEKRKGRPIPGIETFTKTSLNLRTR